MRGIKIIASFLALLGLAYLGVLFVEDNREEVILTIWTFKTKSMALGFLVMSTTLIGIVIGAGLGAIEIFTLILKNRRLSARLCQLEAYQADPLSPAPQPFESQTGSHDTQHDTLS